MTRSKFLGRDVNRYKRLKDKWKRPKGRHNKMRLKRKGYPKTVSIGYKKEITKEKKIVFISNLAGLEKEKGKTIALKKIGKKMKVQIVKAAKEKGIKIKNLNIEKFLKENEKKDKSAVTAKPTEVNSNASESKPRRVKK